jgi:hypothetical protein
VNSGSDVALGFTDGVTPLFYSRLPRARPSRCLGRRFLLGLGGFLLGFGGGCCLRRDEASAE